MLARPHHVLRDADGRAYMVRAWRERTEDPPPRLPRGRGHDPAQRFEPPRMERRNHVCGPAVRGRAPRRQLRPTEARELPGLDVEPGASYGSERYETTARGDTEQVERGEDALPNRNRRSTGPLVVPHGPAF